jgi:hypothetical protein
VDKPDDAQLTAGTFGQLLSQIELLGTDGVARLATVAVDAHRDFMARTIRACLEAPEGRPVPLPSASLALATELALVRSAASAIGRSPRGRTQSWLQRRRPPPPTITLAELGEGLT